MKTFIISIKAVLIFTILTGILYPLLMYGIGAIAFPNKADGSLIIEKGKVIGSELIGQKFDGVIYFHSRPSAVDYQPMPSSGSNLGPTSLALKQRTDSLRKAYIEYNNFPANTVVPPDAIFASGSGIDPHISPENAMMQLNRVAFSRNFNEDKKNKLVELVKKNIQQPEFGFLGETRINVVKLNLELDKLQ